MFGRATITLGIGPHSSFVCIPRDTYSHCWFFCMFAMCICLYYLHMKPLWHAGEHGFFVSFTLNHHWCFRRNHRDALHIFYVTFKYVSK